MQPQRFRSLMIAQLVVVYFCSSNLLAQLMPSQERDLKQAMVFEKASAELASHQKYEEAAVELAKVLKITMDTLGKENETVAGLCRDLAYLLEKAGRFNEALVYFENTVRLYSKLIEPKHPQFTELRRQYGMCLSNAGKPKEAISELTQALEAAGKVYGKDSVEYPRFLNDLGLCFVRSGDWGRGEGCYQECLAIRLKRTDCPPRSLAATYNNLGDVLTKRCDYANARSHFDRALEILRRTDDIPSRLSSATTYNNIGFLYRKQGDLDSAIKWYDKALAEYQAILPPKHPDIALVLLNRGRCLFSQGKHAEAKSNLMSALMIFVSTGPELSVASVLSVISEMEFATGKYKEAAETSESVLAIRKSILGERHPDTLFAVYNVALVNLFLGNTSEAERAFTEAENGLPATLDESSTELASVHFVVGTFFASQNRVVSALERFDRGQKIIAKNMDRVFPGLPQIEQSSYFKKISLGVNQSMSFVLEHSAEQSVVDASFEWIANNKAIVQQSVGRQLQGANLASKDNAIASRLTEVRQHMSSLALTKTTEVTRQEHQLELEGLIVEELDLSRKLADELGIPVSTEGWLKLSDIRKKVPFETRVIDYFRVTPSQFDAEKREYVIGTDHYMAWIIPPSEQGSVRFVDLGSAEVVDELIGQIRERIQSDGVDNGAIDSKGESLTTIALNNEMRKLRDLIWSPIELHLGDSKNVLLCPDSNLWLVPWSAMPLGQSEKVLIEEYTLQFVVSSREIGMTKQSTEKVSQSVIFANPNYEIDRVEKIQSIDAIIKRPIQHNSETGRSILAKSLFGRSNPLPETEKEAEDITPLIAKLDARSPQIFIGNSALESVAKNLRSPKVAVFATHGFFFPLQIIEANKNPLLIRDNTPFHEIDNIGLQLENPLLRCGLLLAGCNRPESSVRGDDGVLTGIEIACMDFRATELVVLSACDTGVGDTRSGESVAGVMQAFKLAGAQSVVATLWKVRDRDTRFFISSFFGNVASGQTYPEAVRNAQLQKIKYRRDTYGAAHPYYWAAWTVTR